MFYRRLISHTLLRIIFWLFLLIVASLIIILQVDYIELRYLAGKLGTDYCAYWSASKLLLSGGNPYSRVQIMSLEQVYYPDIQQPHVVFTPPWTLVFLIPFALIPFHTSSLVWLILTILAALTCGAVLWNCLAESGDNCYWLGTL